MVKEAQIYGKNEGERLHPYAQKGIQLKNALRHGRVGLPSELGKQEANFHPAV
jgi:hypothetical protein